MFSGYKNNCSNIKNKSDGNMDDVRIYVTIITCLLTRLVDFSHHAGLKT